MEMTDSRPEMPKSKAKRKLAEPTVRVGSSHAIPAILRSLGADPAKILAEAGFDLALLDHPDNQISFAARNHLLAHCAASTGCPHFGLLVGQQNGLQSLGLVGLLVRYSPDVETALRNLVHHTHLFVQGAAIALTVDEGVASVSYDIYEPHAEARDQVGDGAIAAICRVVRELCGPDWRPVEARFAHRQPADVGPFRRYFRVPLRFDAEQNALSFPAYWLKRSLPEADPELRRLLQDQIDMLEAHFGDPFPVQVRRVLRTALLTGHGSADQIASLFSMHSRSLNRRLAADGTSFRQLLAECRFELARQLLDDSTMEAGEIAGLLDYAAPGVFTRAFRRWSGTTPSEWRAARKRTR
jgi:AraC-like DNA-binding protein